MDDNRVKITMRYLGVVRLLLGRREDIFEFTGKVSLGLLLEKVKEVLPMAAYEELYRQTLVLSSRPGVPGKILSFTDDRYLQLEDENCLTVVTPVTGG